MTSSTYAPQPDGLAWRVCAFFKRDPEEELSVADIALKFDASGASVRTQLEKSVEAGFIAAQVRMGVRLYSAGPRIAEFDQPRASTSKGRRSLVAPVALPDPSSIVIEKDVAIPPVRRATTLELFADTFARMDVNDSFQVDAACAARILGAAGDWGKANGGRKFAKRQVGEGRVRIWRVA